MKVRIIEINQEDNKDTTRTTIKFFVRDCELL